jgi:hypothetical protein
MPDRCSVTMPRWRFHRYLAWLGASWDLGQTEDAQQVAFAYSALRRMR